MSLTEPHFMPDKLELRQNYFWNAQVILVCSQEFRIPGLRFSFLFRPQDTIGNFSLTPLSIWSLVNPSPYLAHCGLGDFFFFFFWMPHNASEIGKKILCLHNTLYLYIWILCIIHKKPLQKEVENVILL